MRLIEARIEEFGKLQDTTFAFGKGLNLIEGPNESGKSTLLAFLRFVFYGFPRKNSPDGDERDKRLSWKTRRAAGTLIMEQGRKRYQISRNFAVRGTGGREQPTEELSVIALPTGEAVSLGDKTPGEFFMGIPAELYDTSLCVRQSDVERICSPDVGEAVGGFLFSGKSGLGAEQAQSALDAARRTLAHLKGRGGRIAELEDRLSYLREELDRAREDTASLKKHREDIARYRAQVAARRRQLGEISAALEMAEIARTVSMFDEWHKAKEEQDRLSKESSALQAKHKALLESDGRERDMRIRTLLRDHASIGAELLQKQKRVSELRGFEPDKRLLLGAEGIRERGGADKTLGVFNRLRKRKRNATVCFVILLVAALGLGAVSFLFSAMRLYVAAGAALALILSVASLSLSLVRARALRRLLSSIGAQNAAMVRTYLSQCEDEQARERANRDILSRVEEELAKWVAREKNCRERLHAELVAMGCEEGFSTVEAAEEFLREHAYLREVAVSECSAASVAAERAAELSQMIEKRLAGMDEGKLRARLAASAAHAEQGSEELKRNRAFLQESIAGLEAKCSAAERAEAALVASTRNPEDLEVQAELCERELSEGRKRLAAITMALDVMREAEKDLRDGVMPRLCEDASELFGELTGGEHKKLHLAGDFSVALDAPGGVQPLSRFSAGCRDAACLSLRLALLQTVSTKRLPLFFDEALSRLDDTRARALLSVLAQYATAGGQCLLFSCHTREAQWLSENKKVTIITLSQ